MESNNAKTPTSDHTVRDSQLSKDGMNVSCTGSNPHAIHTLVTITVTLTRQISVTIFALQNTSSKRLTVDDAVAVPDESKTSLRGNRSIAVPVPVLVDLMNSRA